MASRYARQTILPGVGFTGQESLAGTKVLVVGAGGLGSPVLQYLVASGIGMIGIVDDDSVELSNLQRQVLFTEQDIGQPKVEAATERLSGQNSDVRLLTHPVRLNPRNAMEVVSGYDMVVDGTDNYATRYLISDACVLAGIPHVWGSVFQFEGQICVWWPERGGPCYRCAFPPESDAVPVPSCAEAGVMGAVCGVIGSAQAVAAIAIALGVNGHSGRLQIYDALVQQWATVTPSKRTDCEACGELAFAQMTARPEYADPACAVADSEDLIDPAELKKLLEWGAGEIRLVDVREASEREEGIIRGDESIPLAHFLSGEALTQLDPADDLVLYCRAGKRSLQAMESIPAERVRRVRSLRGGILNWQS